MSGLHVFRAILMWKKTFGRLVFLFVTGAALVCIYGIVMGSRLTWILSDNPPPVAEPEPVDPEMQLRETLLNYLAQLDASGSEFTKQVIGDAQLQRWNLDTGIAYFSLPAKPGQQGYPQSAVAGFVTRFDEVRFAPADQEVMKLDDLVLPRTPETAFFFATAVQNFAVTPGKRFVFPYRSATYTVSLQETMDYLHNESVVGGLLNAATGKTIGGRELVFSNHGAFVAVRGEPSLKRLADALVFGLPRGPEARELRVQRLLDFVTTEIAYDPNEAGAGVEVLRRPNEILMTRRGDCSNKSILFASLLDQLGEPYLFAYMPGHIAVAVPRGHFGAYNGLTLLWEKKPWVLAETTAVKFRIGVDHLMDETLFPRCEYLQYPPNPNVIVSRLTGERLMFR